MATSANVAGLEALNRLKSVDPPLYLSPSSELSQAARVASQYLFSSIRPFTPKSPFDRLLTDGFDAEQIWQQIDLQSQPLISTLSRHVKNYEKHPDKISRLFGQIGVEKSSKSDREHQNLEIESVGLDAVEDDDMEEFDDDDDEEDEDEREGEKGGERKKDDIDGNDDDEEEEGGGLLEDKFLKIKELEEYLEEDEAREYGLKKNKKSDDDEAMTEESDEDGEGEENEGDEDEEEEDELEALGLDDDENGNTLETARYEDFFGGKNNSVTRKKPKLIDGSDDSDMFGEHSDDENLGQKKGNLSTHERELEKQRSKIEQMEKANLEPKAWIMQGEVTAAKRPKNSALEVDLDFEHNVRPAPVITEEVTASLEELIQKRIAEGRFDDVQKPPTLLSKAPREIKELDENKSKKGLAEVYEEEYVQKSGLVSTALSFSDEQKKEATLLFKKLCLKLDALSHFHFTPKPVIEELSIQTNVPALAIEEIAPVAVSDAAMMAPEEVFTRKGDLKEETELTQAERKRRRSHKKRKFKAETAKRMAKKAEQNISVNLANVEN